MKIINDHIKNNEYKQIYLLCGEEEYLKKQYRDKLKNAMIGEDTMNVSSYEGKKIDVKQLINTGDTMPFFADHRLIIVNDSGFFKTASEEITEYVKNIPEYLIILFVESEVDKRNRLYKAVHEIGYICEMKYQDAGTLFKWIVGLVGAEGKSMDRDAVELLLTKSGVSMDNIKSEIEKLICYCLDSQKITAADVDAVCTTQTTSKIFDMITAIALKKQKQALELYYDLLTLREPPMRILYLITRQFNLLFQVKEFVAKGTNNEEIARTMGVAPFLVGKYMSQAKCFTVDEIKGALEYFADIEESVKTGRIDDKMGVELIIVKYSKK